jgi:sulfatase modifying factor 1
MQDESMIPIPAGRFRMGSVDFYPEEAPVREIEIEAFAIDRAPVTVAQFARFVKDTGYVTLAERPPDAATYPDADPALLREGSIVFHPTPCPVPMDDPTRWWAYVPGACWERPWGPESENAQRADHPVTHIAYETHTCTRGGPASSFRARPSGSTRLAGASTALSSPGASRSDRAVR